MAECYLTLRHVGTFTVAGATVHVLLLSFPQLQRFWWTKLLALTTTAHVWNSSFPHIKCCISFCQIWYFTYKIRHFFYMCNVCIVYKLCPYVNWSCEIVAFTCKITVSHILSSVSECLKCIQCDKDVKKKKKSFTCDELTGTFFFCEAKFVRAS